MENSKNSGIENINQPITKKDLIIDNRGSYFVQKGDKWYRCNDELTETVGDEVKGCLGMCTISKVHRGKLKGRATCSKADCSSVVAEKDIGYYVRSFKFKLEKLISKD